MRRLTRPFWLFIAALFLFEAWFWDKLTLAGRWLRDRLPFAAFKRWLAAVIERLPPWAALLLFLIPLAIVEPLKIVAIWLFVEGHMVLGVLCFVAIKVVGFGAVAFLFDLTRDQLMTFRWFVWCYERIDLLLAWAAALIAPYKQALKLRMVALKARVLALLGMGGGKPSRLARWRDRIRAR